MIAGSTGECFPPFTAASLGGPGRGHHWKDGATFSSSIIFLVFLLDWFIFMICLRARGYYYRFDFCDDADLHPLSI